jgi:DNA gyrase subunit A
MGVRGINLSEGDKLISLTILGHMDVNADERAAYLRRANAVRRGGVEDEAGTDTEEATGAIELGEQRYVDMSASEQFVLTISENGYGKRTSSYEYRTTGRGGKGIVAMSVNNRNGKLASLSAAQWRTSVSQGVPRRVSQCSTPLMMSELFRSSI